MPERSPRRIRFVQAEVQQLSPAVCMARVELERLGPGGRTSAVGACPETEGLRGAAKAAAEALMQAVGNDPALEVRGVEMVTAFGEPAVMVHVGAKHQERWQSLMGFCIVGTEDPARAAALAVLNATNRMLDIG